MSYSSVPSAAARTFAVDTWSEPARAGSVTWTARVAPIARALRSVSGALVGAIESRVISPSPAASINLSAASRTYSSLPLTTAGAAARSRRPSGPRRSPAEAGSGTGFTRTTMRTRRVPFRASAVLAEQCPRDDQPLDLLGAFVELGELRVAHHPLHRELVDVAIAPEHLDGVGGDAHRGIPGHEFTHRRPSAGVRR